MTPTFSGTPLSTGIINGYCTLADLRLEAVLNFTASDTTNDALLEAIITSVSRGIDGQTGRFFYKSTAHEVKYFTPNNPNRIFVGDVVSVTALYTDTLSGDRSYPFTWSSTDYDLWPYDSATISEPEPYRYIETAPQGIYQFPVGVAKAVKLDAVYGWNAVPTLIAKACLLWSARVYKRLATPLGVQAMSELGSVSLKLPPPDPDVAMMLSNYTLVAV